MIELISKALGIVETIIKYLFRPVSEKEAEKKLSAQERWDSIKEEIERRKLLRR